MPKIDVTKIEGYAEMTAEQKIAALEGFELTFDTTGFVKKSVYDKTASDLADAKKKLREKQTDDEKAEEAQRQKDERLKELEREVGIGKHVKKLMDDGYDAENAEKAAAALFDGDTETFFSVQKSVMEAIKKSVTAKKLEETPDPASGFGDSAVDYKKKIEEAQMNGNLAEAVYYTRLWETAKAEEQ